MYSITWTVISGNSPLRVEVHILFCLGTHLGSGSLCLDFTCTRVKGVFTVALLNCNPVVEVCSWYVCNVKGFFFSFFMPYSSSLPLSPTLTPGGRGGQQNLSLLASVYTKWSTQDLIHAYLGTCVWGHPYGFYIKAVTTCFSQLGFQELLSLEACCSFHGSQSFILTPVA